MSVINIVDSDNNLVASISGDDVILKNGYNLADNELVNVSTDSKE